MDTQETTSTGRRESPVDCVEVAQQLERLAHVAAMLDLPDAHVMASVSMLTGTTDDLEIDIHCWDLDQVRDARRSVGRCEKEERTGGGFLLRGEVNGVKVSIWPPRDTCRQVQVGTERRRVVQTVETDEFEDVPVYEWDCGPLLADDPDEAVSA